MSSTDEGRLESMPAKRVAEQQWLWSTGRALELTAATRVHLPGQVVFRIGFRSRADDRQPGAWVADRDGDAQVRRRRTGDGSSKI